MTVLVDSCAWIEYFKGSKSGEKIRKYIDSDVEILSSVINLAEIYRYMLAYNPEKYAKEALDFILKRSFYIPVSLKISIEAAKIRHEKKFGLGDALIYSTALLTNSKVLTVDKHFKDESNVIFIDK